MNENNGRIYSVDFAEDIKSGEIIPVECHPNSIVLGVGHGGPPYSTRREILMFTPGLITLKDAKTIPVKSVVREFVVWDSRDDLDGYPMKSRRVVGNFLAPDTKNGGRHSISRVLFEINRMQVSGLNEHAVSPTVTPPEMTNAHLLDAIRNVINGKPYVWPTIEIPKRLKEVIDWTASHEAIGESLCQQVQNAEKALVEERSNLADIEERLSASNFSLRETRDQLAKRSVQLAEANRKIRRFKQNVGVIHEKLKDIDEEFE